MIYKPLTYLVGGSLAPALLLSACSLDVPVGLSDDQETSDEGDPVNDDEGADGDGGSMSTDMDDMDDMGSTGGGHAMGGSSNGTDDEGDCDDTQAGYFQWLSLENEVSEDNLLGKTFEGYVEGGAELTLSFTEDGEGTLTVADWVGPAEDRTKGYLCDVHTPGEQWYGDGCQELIEGAVYPLHGVEVRGGRVLVDLKRNSPFESWCELQQPARMNAEENPCGWGLLHSSSTQLGSEVCTIDDAPVDCGWLRASEMLHARCSCNSDDCVPNIHLEQSDIRLDLRLSDEGDELTGSLIEGDSNKNVVLELD